MARKKKKIPDIVWAVIAIGGLFGGIYLVEQEVKKRPL